MLQWFVRFPEFAEFTEFLSHSGKTQIVPCNVRRILYMNLNANIPFKQACFTPLQIQWIGLERDRALIGWGMSNLVFLAVVMIAYRKTLKLNKYIKSILKYKLTVLKSSDHDPIWNVWTTLKPVIQQTDLLKPELRQCCHCTRDDGSSSGQRTY